MKASGLGLLISIGLFWFPCLKAYSAENDIQRLDDLTTNIIHQPIDIELDFFNRILDRKEEFSKKFVKDFYTIFSQQEEGLGSGQEASHLAIRILLMSATTEEIWGVFISDQIMQKIRSRLNIGLSSAGKASIVSSICGRAQGTYLRSFYSAVFNLVIESVFKEIQPEDPTSSFGLGNHINLGHQALSGYRNSLRAASKLFLIQYLNKVMDVEQTEWSEDQITLLARNVSDLAFIFSAAFIIKKYNEFHEQIIGEFHNTSNMPLNLSEWFKMQTLPAIVSSLSQEGSALFLALFYGVLPGQMRGNFEQMLDDSHVQQIHSLLN